MHYRGRRGTTSEAGPRKTCHQLLYKVLPRSRQGPQYLHPREQWQDRPELLDLLLSIATSQWKELDARQAVNRLVDELNSIGQGFNFDKDMVLKSGLMLNDIPSVAFQVRNFNASNMSKLESSWDNVRSTRQTVRLLADFGFNDRTLSAKSVVIPIAYYLYKRQVPESYFTDDSHAKDRESIRTWVARSIIKSAYGEVVWINYLSLFGKILPSMGTISSRS